MGNRPLVGQAFRLKGSLSVRCHTFNKCYGLSTMEQWIQGVCTCAECKRRMGLGLLTCKLPRCFFWNMRVMPTRPLAPSSPVSNCFIFQIFASDVARDLSPLSSPSPQPALTHLQRSRGSLSTLSTRSLLLTLPQQRDTSIIPRALLW
jgi:hypothetical protein